jgi:hypothetical protein
MTCGGDSHRPRAGISLGLGIERGPAAEPLDATPPDRHLARRHVDISTAKPEHLTSAQAAPAGQEHSGAVPRGDRVDQGDDLGREAGGRSFDQSELAPAISHGFLLIAPSRRLRLIMKPHACQTGGAEPAHREARHYRT